MDQGINKIFFALLRSAICGTKLKEDEVKQISTEMLDGLMKLASKQDMAHVLVYGLKQNDLISEKNDDMENRVYSAVYRCEQMKYEYERLCEALEKAQIPFVPLKGSVLRRYYPEEWIRTSCDIDILIHIENMEKAISGLSEALQYEETGRTTHDVSMFSQSGVHVELHFDLMEEICANNAMNILGDVWDNVCLREGKSYWYEMQDAFFYFYHIAHMAKHIETGGCGVRPFVDLWILDHFDSANRGSRDELLARGGLLKFANSSRALNEVWFGARKHEEITLQLETYILAGGTYGSSYNRVAIQQKKSGGRVGYVLSRMFIPFTKLKRYYPILEKHPWLMPFMQARRWFMLLTPRVARMAKSELVANDAVGKEKADQMHSLLNNIGLE